MKALTVCQPHAHLILQGRKTCENRTWPTSYRGPLYIHAGKSRQWLSLDEGGREYGIHVNQMAFGAVVALCNLVDCIHIESILMDKWTDKMTEEQIDHVKGPYCWMVSNVVPVKPIPWRGAQGLFDIDEAEFDRVVNRQLGIATLTPPMRRCIAAMRQYNNMIDRYPGGFWNAGPTGSTSFGTSTVEALVSRGIAEYTEWQDGRRGRFPIRAVLKESK